MRRHTPRGQGAPSTIRCIETGPGRPGCRPGAPRQGAPSTIRCIETVDIPAAPSTIRCIETSQRWGISPAPMAPVRERPAPSGALKLDGVDHDPGPVHHGRGAPSTIRCIKTMSARSWTICSSYRQGAPSTIRCIKTRKGPRSRPCAYRLRQGVPSTIRCIETWARRSGSPRPPVREHPAPPGALRCDCERTTISTPALRQGAPSTIRRIETLDVPEVLVVRVQSGSTQHHQVHLRPCSRGAGRGPLPKWQGAEADRHRDGAACGRVVSAPGASFCPEVRTQGPRIRQRCSHTRAESSRCVRCCVA